MKLKFLKKLRDWGRIVLALYGAYKAIKGD